MSNMNSSVRQSLERWERDGLIDGELAGRLRDEAIEHAGKSSRAMARWAVAGVGALFVIIAGIRFVQSIFPSLSLEVRGALTALAGAALYLVGARIRATVREEAAAMLAQLAGLSLIWVSAANSEEVYADGSGAAVAIGLASILLAAAITRTSVTLRGYAPAMRLPFVLAFLVVGLTRIGMSLEAAVWVTDGVLALILGALIVRWRSAEGTPERWVEGALMAGFYGGFVMVGLTAIEIDIGDQMSFAIDMWWALVMTMVYLGWQRAPERERSWYEVHIAFMVLGGTFLLYWTLLDPVDLRLTVVAPIAAAFAAVYLAFAIRVQSVPILSAATFCVALGAWFWAIENSSAGSVVTALSLTGLLLFWMSSRIGEFRSGTPAAGEAVDGPDTSR